MQRMRVPTYPVLKSRWTAIVLVLGLLFTIGLWTLGFRRTAVWTLFTLPLLGAIGLLWPDLTLRPYEAWDRLARRARRAARLWLTGVVFGSITAVGIAGSRLQRSPPIPEHSGWFPKTPPPGGGHAGEVDASDRSRGWVRRYAKWAWSSGNLWSCSLLPALMLLKAVEGVSKGSLGGDVYTLY